MRSAPHTEEGHRGLFLITLNPRGKRAVTESETSDCRDTSTSLGMPLSKIELVEEALLGTSHVLGTERRTQSCSRG